MMRALIVAMALVVVLAGCGPQDELERGLRLQAEGRHAEAIEVLRAYAYGHTEDKALMALGMSFEALVAEDPRNAYVARYYYGRVFDGAADEALRQEARGRYVGVRVGQQPPELRAGLLMEEARRGAQDGYLIMASSAYAGAYGLYVERGDMVGASKAASEAAERLSAMPAGEGFALAEAGIMLIGGNAAGAAHVLALVPAGFVNGPSIPTLERGFIVKAIRLMNTRRAGAISGGGIVADDVAMYINTFDALHAWHIESRGWERGRSILYANAWMAIARDAADKRMTSQARQAVRVAQSLFESAGRTDDDAASARLLKTL